MSQPAAKRKVWTAPEIEVLMQRYPHESTLRLAQELGRAVTSVWGKSRELGLKKTPAYLATAEAGRLRVGLKVGQATRFKPGQVSWNKGRHFMPGGRSTETRFKAGMSATNWQPIGTVRINSDGYLDRKVSNTGRCNVDWKQLHRLVWEEVHGPIPAGQICAFKDGNKQNCDPANLVLRTRREHMAINTIANYPPELRSAMHLVAKVRRKLDERKQ